MIDDKHPEDQKDKSPNLALPTDSSVHTEKAITSNQKAKNTKHKGSIGRVFALAIKWLWTSITKDTRRAASDFRETKMGERFMVYVTLAGIFIAAYTIRVFREQLNVMADQLAEMRTGSVDTRTLAQAAKRQADKAETISTSIQQAVTAMNTSNAQSKQVLDATIAASRLDQRAWVGVVDVVTEGGKVDGDAFSFKSIGIAIRNTGKTPALRMTVDCCTYTTRSWNEKEIPDYDTEMIKNQESEKAALEQRIKQHPEWAERITRWHEEWEKELAKDRNAMRHEGDLAPQATIGVNVGISVKQAGLESLPPPQNMNPKEMESYYEQVKGRPRFFYVVGKIVYSDIFANTKQHTTTICLVRNPGANSLAFSICSQGRMD